MARGGGRSGSGRLILNELSQNGEPPQSTLAAQLVSHFTDGKKHPRTQDEETFRQLLREILGTESGQLVRAEPPEMDSDVDCKLIYVIVKAGLERINSDDMFGGKTEMARQAADSLAAINFTVRRNPEVLFVALQVQGPEPRPVGPLYLWLLPKLLALAGSLQDKETTDGLLRVFTTFFVTERKTHVRRMSLHPVSKYVKGCING
ncbi:serine/threonine-protein kinase M1 [Imshaugia aleurites]|uniref:Serine/threonine-protein kinase M1 n=1 Tax=Imshaugia aleurites TaxID=172621 RepID=A0A8H3FX20_9LECA|nr:serine/threonine-protein kinase M1 [Imshaugia aleurites]